jgi:signal peptidase II
VSTAPANSESTLSNRTIALAVAATVLALDQITKVLVVATIDRPVELVGEFLRLRVIRNPGGAFGTLQNSGVLLGLVAVVAAFILVRLSGEAEKRAEALVFGLILGGAVGNLADRIFRGDGVLDGAVVDFIDFDFFPAFNVADSCITIGAILAILLSLRRE